MQGESFQNASELHSKPLHFCTHKSSNCTQNFFCKTRRQRTSKMCLNSTANSFIFGSINRENALRELFLYSLKGEKFQNVSELHSKPLHFWTHKLWNCAHNFFCKPCRQSTFEMRLNFMANSFVFGCTNREIAPRTFSVKIAGRELLKYV